MNRTGVVRDRRYLEHRTGINHIEVPRRLEAIYSMIDGCDLKDRLVPVTPRLASLEEIQWVHTPDYIEKILDTAGESLRYLDPDTVTSEQSCMAAFLAAGGVFEAVEAVISGSLDNAFALIRPPGHHAERDRQMGFCLFNNVALAAEYARRRHGLERVLIVDFDLHHPNGTQHIFEDSDHVLLFTTHRFPFFPGSGAIEEVGFGPGAGYTVNVPLPAHCDDADFSIVYEQLLLPLGEAFRPQLVLVSAGFDTHFDDPIGGMRMTERGYGRIMRMVMQIADAHCRGGVIVMLEGGYDLSAMRKSARAVLETMLQPEAHESASPALRSGSPVPDIIDSVRLVHGPYWKVLGNV